MTHLLPTGAYSVQFRFGAVVSNVFRGWYAAPVVSAALPFSGPLGMEESLVTLIGANFGRTEVRPRGSSDVLRLNSPDSPAAGS